MESAILSTVTIEVGQEGTTKSQWPCAQVLLASTVRPFGPGPHGVHRMGAEVGGWSQLLCGRLEGKAEVGAEASVG